MPSSQNDAIDSSSAPARSIDARDFSHELVPLGLATRLICARVYAASGCTPERLAGIAQLIGALAPLYTHSADGASIRRLKEEELLSSSYRKGGAELYFLDGRQPIDKLAVSHRSVEEVERLLNSAVNGEDCQISCSSAAQAAVRQYSVE
jgi:hypothetical protein